VTQTNSGAVSSSNNSSGTKNNVAS
jgi:hypothetical protein